MDFHDRVCPGAFAYYWFLNDDCRDEHVTAMAEAFAAAGVGAVCLHPRAGLSLPYGGEDWFEFIERTVETCSRLGLRVWLYDEDPYPSGNAGGRIIMDRPELQARHIECDVAPCWLQPGDLFEMDPGRLLWAGFVPSGPDDTREPVDLTGRVGVVRTKWWVLDPWDSRWYYPGTPLYDCPRSGMRTPKLALRMPTAADGMQLQAFVARPAGKPEDVPWDGLVDTLNPAATEEFLQRTHEPYRERLGDRFGGDIPAIYTDEPKYFGQTPWTPGMFEAFARAFGYDLRSRLWHLFCPHQTPAAMLTRLHYREWCGRRFEDAWLRPVAGWCARNGIALVGHISPEDDPVEQAASVTNLAPMFKYFGVPGIDVIIPAVGDARHAILNVGVVLATSAGQQQGRPGVLSESLGASGLDCTVDEIAGILHWQVAMGLTLPVIHAAFSSVAGGRLIDAPPDSGPLSDRWDGMVALQAELAPVLARLRGARQRAPVAMLWPIRSFMADGRRWQAEPGGLRGELFDLLLDFLEHQTGVHFVDEAALAEAVLRDGSLRVGQAAYTHLVVPPTQVVLAETAARLGELHEHGFPVRMATRPPQWMQTARALVPAHLGDVPVDDPECILSDLPTLALLPEADRRQVRLTAWQRDGRPFGLFYSLADAPLDIELPSAHVTLAPRRVTLVDGI